MGMALGRLAVLVAVLVGVASCGDGAAGAGSVSVAAGPSGSASGGSSAPVSPTSAAAAAAGGYPGTICRSNGVLPYLDPPATLRLAAGFVPVVVAACSVETELVAGDGQWAVLVEKRAASGLAPVVAAVRRADEHALQASCTSELDLDPQVWFIDANGRAVLPRWPRDSCGHLFQDVRVVLAALTWTTTAQVRLKQLTPQAALDAGCPTAVKYMVQMTADESGAAKAGTFADLAHVSAPPLCQYTRTGADPGDGTFESGRPLSATAWTALRQALDGAPPAKPCTQAATRFVVLDTSAFVEIELDGCHRVLTPDNALRQATPRLLALLT